MQITRTTVSRETARRMRHLGLQNGEEIRRLRTDAGVSLGDLGAVVGVNKSHLARIESNQVQPSLKVLTSIGVALGADLSIRYFPGSGPRLHDRFQARMVEAFLRVLDPRWLIELEVPIVKPARGVIDAVLYARDADVRVAVEVYSELRRLEQQIRWSTEKADGLAQRIVDEHRLVARPTIFRLLVLRSTVVTRETARTYGSTLAAAYPARTSAVVEALTTSTALWPGSGVVWMQVDGREASLMSFPPPRVDLGR